MRAKQKSSTRDTVALIEGLARDVSDLQYDLLKLKLEVEKQADAARRAESAANSALRRLANEAGYTGTR